MFCLNQINWKMINSLCYCNIDWAIFWSMISALTTLGILFVGNKQLKKIRSQNSLQILFHLEEEWNSERMRKKRKLLAIELGGALINPDTIRGHSTLPNQIEDILDFFEKVSYLTNSKELNFELVYQIYSYHFIYYWAIIKHLEFLSYVRRRGPNNMNLYSNCEILYDKISKERDTETLQEEDLLKFCGEEEGNLDNEK